MIEVKELVKTFDRFRALDGLNITAPTGAIYGLVGPNGAGKSTVIRHLAGIYRQDSGKVLIDGSPVYENPAVKRKIAYIPDEVFYYPQARIKDMADFYRSIYPSFDDARFKELGEMFDLDPNSLVRRLSKGMQKQAAFWTALSLCPEVIVLDEPIDGLDPAMRRQVCGILLSDVAENGTTVFVSSHNLRELQDICTHVGVMSKGRMLLERSMSELQENIVKIQLYIPDGKALPCGLDILHRTAVGHVEQLIIRGRADQVSALLSASGMPFVDVLPLSLEEIFIYELGGVDHASKEIIL